MLTEIMRHISNHFALDRNSRLYGAENGVFTVEKSTVGVTSTYIAGQYVAIQGSFLNDGVYKVEAFSNGVISFVPLVSEYPPWVKPTGAANAYKIGDKVSHEGERYISLIDVNTVPPNWAGSEGVQWERVIGIEIQDPLRDETFDGTIYKLKVPYDFLEMVIKIEEFTKREGKPSNVVSASFGIQSTSFATDSKGQKATWENVYAKSLDAYRRYTPDIEI